ASEIRDRAVDSRKTAPWIRWKRGICTPSRGRKYLESRLRGFDRRSIAPLRDNGCAPKQRWLFPGYRGCHGVAELPLAERRAGAGAVAPAIVHRSDRTASCRRESSRARSPVSRL